MPAAVREASCWTRGPARWSSSKAAPGTTTRAGPWTAGLRGLRAHGPGRAGPDPRRGRWTRFGLIRCAIHHRTGTVPLREAAVVVGCASAHRREAFAAAAWIMDRIKECVPIWKKEAYGDGQAAWVEGDTREPLTRNFGTTLALPRPEVPTMDPAYYVAAGSLKARSFQLETVSNNLANATTVGYKPEKSFFSALQQGGGAGRGLPLYGLVERRHGAGLQGHGLLPGRRSSPRGARWISPSQGPGFFMIQTPAGVQATRDGRFTMAKGPAPDPGRIPGTGQKWPGHHPGHQRPGLQSCPTAPSSRARTPSGQLDIVDYAQPRRPPAGGLQPLRRLGPTRQGLRGHGGPGFPGTERRGHGQLHDRHDPPATACST